MAAAPSFARPPEEVLKRAAIPILLALLTFAYLWPAFTPVFEGDTSKVMSDGTDAATLPYMYGALLETLRDRPAELFYGAVPSRHLNSPEGFALWIPWSERGLALLASVFTPLEHISTVYVALLMFLNAVIMYALGRALGWPRGLSLALAIAWAFCPFTRARAQVHAGFAGTYHVPLALLATHWALGGRSRGSLIAAAVGFMLVAMAPHYFVITLAFVCPWLILIAGLASSKPNFKRLALALVPMLLLLTWCYLKPLPADLLASGASAYPPSGDPSGGAEAHSFLTRFAAEPTDFFTGDLALGVRDVIPWRAELSAETLNHLGGSNPHERANGIRWVIWLAALYALWAWPRGERRLQAAIVLFGLFTFWFSLGPPGPAAWLYDLVSQIRVPSRAGMFVHFSVLLICGWGLRELKPRYLWILPLLVVADLPPFFQEMKLAKVRPALSSLARENCGAGMYYPYVAGNWGVIEDYHFLQEMRGTTCDLINRQWPNPASEKMRLALGLSLDSLRAFNSGDWRLLKHVAQCAGLSFVVFDPRTQFYARKSFCEDWGGQMTEDRVCLRAPAVFTKNPAECF